MGLWSLLKLMSLVQFFRISPHQKQDLSTGSNELLKVMRCFLCYGMERTADSLHSRRLLRYGQWKGFLNRNQHVTELLKHKHALLLVFLPIFITLSSHDKEWETLFCFSVHTQSPIFLIDLITKTTTPPR